MFGIPYGWYDHEPSSDVTRAAINHHRFWLKPGTVDPNQPQGMGHAHKILNPETVDPDRVVNWADFDSGRTIEPRTWNSWDSDSYEEDEGRDTPRRYRTRPGQDQTWSEEYGTWIPRAPGSNYTFNPGKWTWEKIRSDQTWGPEGWQTREPKQQGNWYHQPPALPPQVQQHPRTWNEQAQQWEWRYGVPQMMQQQLWQVPQQNPNPLGMDPNTQGKVWRGPALGWGTL
jgi:hypothetical protein